MAGRKCAASIDALIAARSADTPGDTADIAARCGVSLATVQRARRASGTAQPRGRPPAAPTSSWPLPG